MLPDATPPTRTRPAGCRGLREADRPRGPRPARGVPDAGSRVELEACSTTSTSASPTARPRSASTTPSSACSASRASDGRGFAEWDDFSSRADGARDAAPAHRLLRPQHELVDAFHRAGVEAGFTDDGAPGPRPQYAPSTTAPSCSTPTATASRPCTLDERARAGQIDHLWLRAADVATRHALLRHDRARRRASRSARTARPRAAGRPTAARSRSSPASEPTEHVHIAFAARRRRARSTPSTRPRSPPATATTARPASAPIYHPGYYGAFVLDPDGHNVEAVNHNR